MINYLKNINTLNSVKNDKYQMKISQLQAKNAKLDELINIYSKANMTEKENVYEMLYQVYPSETNRLDQIKKTEN